jgi:predicted secreted protein
MKSLALLFSGLFAASTGLLAAEKPITVAPGQEFKITLESTPSSGHQWLIAKPLDERLLKLLGSEYKRGRPGVSGAAGNEILSFKALSEGKTQIALKYGHLWEKDVEPARTTNFVVVITK